MKGDGLDQYLATAFTFEEIDELLADEREEIRHVGVDALEAMARHDPDTRAAVQWVLYHHMPVDREYVERALQQIALQEITEIGEESDLAQILVDPESTKDA